MSGRTLAAGALLLAVALAGCVGSDDPLGGSGAAAGRPSDPAAFLLRAPYSDLVVEVDYVEGREPSPGALSHLVDVVEDATRKRSVELLGPTVVEVEDPGPDAAWNHSERWALHERTYSLDDPHAKGAGDAAVLHVLYLNGGIGDEGRQREVATGHVVFIAPDGIDGDGDVWICNQDVGVCEQVNVTAPPTGHDDALYRETLETYLLVHGVGHALGLVDAPLPMVEDRLAGWQACQCHSTSKDSVMGVYHKDWINGVVDKVPRWRDTRELLWNDLLDVPITFDEHDIEDIRAFQRANGDTV